MGRVRYLWERNAEFKKKIATFEAQRQELESQQTRTASEMQQLCNQIKELQEEKGRLLQQLEDARTPPLRWNPAPRRLHPKALMTLKHEQTSYNAIANGSAENEKLCGTKYSSYKLSTRS